MQILKYDAKPNPNPNHSPNPNLALTLTEILTLTTALAITLTLCPYFFGQMTLRTSELSPKETHIQTQHLYGHFFQVNPGHPAASVISP